MNRWRRWRAVVVALLVASTAGAACEPVDEAVRDAPNTCPLDIAQWGPLRGAEPTLGGDFYRQADNGITDPSFWLPQQVVTAGEQWWFGFDTTVEAGEGAAEARIAVDWYSTPAGDNSGYLGQDTGPWVEVPVGPAHATDVGHAFTAPPEAVRANVLTKLRSDSPDNTWTGRNCDYRRAGPPTTTTTTTTTTNPPTTPAGPTTNPARPPADPSSGSGGTDTAAGRHGWGDPLPEWSDEFDYGAASAPAVPDRAKWNLAGDRASGCWPGHTGHGRRCEENTTVVGGILRQVGEANGDSGWLGSRFGQRYGRWEARVRSEATGPDNGRQYHPLLVLWPDSERWPQGAEYDYLENSVPGAPCIEAFVHYPHPEAPDPEQEPAQRCGVDLTQWHNVAVEWTADHVKGFVDGEEWFSFSGGADGFRQCIQCAPGPMHQTIQLDDVFGDDMQSAVYEVDWVRIYPPP